MSGGLQRHGSTAMQCSDRPSQNTPSFLRSRRGSATTCRINHTASCPHLHTHTLDPEAAKKIPPFRCTCMQESPQKSRYSAPHCGPSPRCLLQSTSGSAGRMWHKATFSHFGDHQPCHPPSHEFLPLMNYVPFSKLPQFHFLGNGGKHLHFDPQSTPVGT